jgi:KDO2-lipid IV(A) lauroyltransferase
MPRTRNRKDLRGVLSWLALRTGAFLARIVPLRVSYGVARTAGSLAYWLWPGGRRRTIDNMRHVTEGDEALARRYARQSLANYAVFLVDFLRSMSATPEDIRRRVIFDRWEQLQALRDGNGIVFVTMHFGNWDLGAATLALHDFPITVVADSFDNPRIDRLVRQSREYLGMTIIPAERTGPGILRALRRNDVIAALADVPASSKGAVEVRFFGDVIRVYDGVARIALRTGATVVAATLPRHAPWSDRVDAWVEPVPFEPSGDGEADARALTQAIFERFEGMVRRRPDQWYIFRHLWASDAARSRA